MINIKSCTKAYNAENNFVLNELDFKMNKGESVVIIGESGSGKSTFLNIIGLIDSMDTGTYTFDSVNTGKLRSKNISEFRNKKIGIVFQDYYLIPYLSVEENIEMPLIYGKVKKNERTDRVTEIMKKLNIHNLSKKNVSKLSGGEKQRVAIARAVIMKPKLLIADEPTGNLDPVNTKVILDLFELLNEEGMSIIVVTHNYEFLNVFKKIYKLQNGELELQK